MERTSSKSILVLCTRGMVQLTPYISLLRHLTFLQLCCNMLTSIPDEIGHLTMLRVLDLSNNNIEFLTPYIGNLRQLSILKLGRNRLRLLPRSIGQLQNLERLRLNNNLLVSLPSELGICTSLISLDVCENPLCHLPVELSRLEGLQFIRREGCPFEEKTDSIESDDVRWNLVTMMGKADTLSPPSLREFACRVVIRHGITTPSDASPLVKQYMARVKYCSECGGPFIDWWLSRTRFVNRSIGELPFEHRMCWFHWLHESDRILSMFTSLPRTVCFIKNPSFVRMTLTQ